MDTETVIASGAVSIVVVAIGHLLNRKKTGAETEKIRADSIGKRLENAEEFIEFYKKKADDAIRENRELFKEMTEAEARHTIEISDVNRACAEQMKDMSDKLHERIEDLESENAMLKNQLSKQ